MLPSLEPVTRRTMYFIGVTTGASSIMRIFPKWSAILGLDAELRGYDAPLHAPPDVYRRIIGHIKADPLVVGGLVTTHKIDLLHAARDLFDYLDPYAKLCSEVSSISKLAGRLEGHALDPISSGLTWETFVPRGHFAKTGGHVLCLGSGGAAIAISVYLAGLRDHANQPRRLIAVDPLQARLDALQSILGKLDSRMAVQTVCNADPAQNDELMADLPPGSVVINATGLGKDRPGSPLTERAVFPLDGLVWELNYRGELDFLQQARRQASSRRLTIEDGWTYFLHGWSQVLAQIFHFDLTPDLFMTLAQAALPEGRAAP